MKVKRNRIFLLIGMMVILSLLLVACGGGEEPAPAEEAPAEEAPTEEALAEEMPVKEGLAEGMIGGPTGFEGAERYQYGPDSPAGRAILGILALPDDQKPDKLVFQIPDGAIGHFEVPFPEGAPTALEVWKEETGIDIEFVGISPDDQFTKIIQDTTTQAGQFDVYSFWGPDRGTLSETGALLTLDDFVEKYKPEWEKHYSGGAATVKQFNSHAGEFVAVSFDGDYQIWIYRTDLFEDPENQAAFKEQYGYDLACPETWDQLDDIGEFFTQEDGELWGVTDLRNQYWGFTNWYQRYTSFASPNQMYFDPDTAEPLINSEAGIKATQEFADTLAYHSPDALSWGWPEQYANMAAGGAAITNAFPNMPKFLDSPDNPDSQIAGKMGSCLTPGRIVDGELIRRTVWWPNVTFGVSSQSEFAEAAYLFLQWGNSPEIFTWMVGNPAGFFDPFQNENFTDPIVAGSYKDYHIPVYVESIERAVPPININGTNEYVNALDTNLQAVMTGQKTAEEAMADTAAEWEEITDRLGRDRQIEQLQAELDGWPTITDTPSQ